MYNQLYTPNYLNNANQQNFYENIDNQISRLQQLKEQFKNNQQPTNLTQNFQISPINKETIKYVSSIDEVNKEHVFADTPFFSKDLSVLWIKNANGNIKAFELNEIVEKDEKDLQIEFLQAQIDELKKGMIIDEQPITNDISTKDETNTTRNDETVGEPIKESKSTSFQRVSTSKKK